jgi:hypothetical protein
VSGCVLEKPVSHIRTSSSARLGFCFLACLQSYAPVHPVTLGQSKHITESEKGKPPAKPSQIKFWRPAQMALFAKITSHPPLGQLSIIPPSHEPVSLNHSPFASATDDDNFLVHFHRASRVEPIISPAAVGSVDMVQCSGLSRGRRRVGGA